ncbi:T9SS type A sorting domain-containing protein [Xanthomarina sp. F1114]|uniref:T9SS type A sorting domain-containing protein n=1 Tax=Xanthomarina sp. F1114 TaxID=2996019 RepID=UPI00225E14AF|nr:T9SS type A sorting domain-containing protein [Xanthomarina sp. F1114]MCX7547076.1 T9SS type A sorting domain-containing protein [Xanthomarina sp. F1114]
MKQLFQKTMLLLLVFSAGILHSQGPLTGGEQTSNLPYTSTTNWVAHSTSDKNEKLYAIAYTLEDKKAGNYFKVYDGSSFNALTPSDIHFSNYASFARIKLDKENNVYVLYRDKPSSNNYNIKTYLKKYNASGTLIGSRVMAISNSHATDLAIAPNGDVLVGGVENNKIIIKVFRNMSYIGTLSHMDELKLINDTRPFSIHMDMKEEKLAVGYSFGPLSQSKLNIKRYTYNPNNVSISFHSHYYEPNSRFNRLEANQIALRSNWEVFFNANISSSPPFTETQVKFLSGQSSTVFQEKRGFIDVDIKNRLVISKNYGSLAEGSFKVSLFDSSNNFIHEYEIDAKIKNHLESVAIYDCDFIVTGIDRKLYANPNNPTYQSFHQVFNCGEICGRDGTPMAAAQFRFPNGENEYQSYYGPIKITELCLIDDLLVDGSASGCETRYFVSLAEFDLGTWTDINLLHSAWVSPFSEAPNDINIVDFLPQGYHLRPGKIYRFKLAVGNPWDSVELFFEVTCCKREIIEDPHHDYEPFKYSLTFGEEEINNTPKDVNFKVSPNPAQNHVALDFSDIKSKGDKTINIRNLQGIKVYSNKTQDQKETIDVKSWPTGLYLITVETDGKSYQNKVIKK